MCVCESVCVYVRPWTSVKTRTLVLSVKIYALHFFLHAVELLLEV